MNQHLPKKTKRLEFSNKTKQQALIEQDFKCVDCETTDQLEFDHEVPDGLRKNNSLKNCKLRCPECHKRKTRKDQADITRAKRLYAKANNLQKPKRKKIPTSANYKWPKQKFRSNKPPKALYKEKI